MNIDLHIERLVFDGVDIGPGQGPALQVAVQAELVRLLTQGGLAPRLEGGGTVPSIAGPTLRIDAGAGPAELGKQVAGAVYGGIGR